MLALQIRTRHQLGEMPVAQQILAQEHDARGRRALARLANPGIDADQGLDAGGLRFLVELHHRKQIALIGEGHRRHPRRRDRRHQFRHAHDAVDQRVLGVQAQVDECSSRFAPQRQAHRLEGAPMQGQGPCSSSSR